MHGAIPPLPQHAFMARCSVKIKCTGTTLPLPFIVKLQAQNVNLLCRKRLNCSHRDYFQLLSLITVAVVVRFTH
jgi:hypothetical protein